MQDAMGNRLQAACRMADASMSAKPDDLLPARTASEGLESDRRGAVESASAATAGRGWRPGWPACGLIALLAAVALVYFSRLTVLPIRGEEPRRARVAIEMIESGDWIVPRQQGEVYFSRPPLQNWAIGLLGLVRGEVDAVAIRTPSVLAVLLSVVFIYGYCRGFLSAGASLAAGVAFATMVEMLKLGRLGETDAMFTAMLAGAMLTWHHGYAHAWPARRTWVASYLLVGLAMLTKGPQGPVYFLASVTFFLLVVRDLRYLFTRAHVLGLLAFVLVCAAWQVPYQIATGWQSVWTMYSINVTQRFEQHSVPWSHYLGFPFESLGCMLPWSVLLLAYLDRRFGNAIVRQRSQTLFLFSCVLVSLAACWVVPGGRTRYMMPVYPCVACLVGLVIDRYGRPESAVPSRGLVWSGFVLGCAGLMAVASLALAVADCVSPSTWSGAALWLPGLGALLVWVLWRLRGAILPAPRLAAVSAIGLFVAVSAVGVVLTVERARSETATADAVAQVKESLPPDAHLVSVGRVLPLFAYYYRDLIEVGPEPAEDANWWQSVDYFSCSAEMIRDDAIPFPYRIIARVPCDRFRGSESQNVVVVGVRLRSEDDGLATRAAAPSQSETFRR